MLHRRCPCVSKTRDFRGVRSFCDPLSEIRSPTLISRACAAYRMGRRACGIALTSIGRGRRRTDRIRHGRTLCHRAVRAGARRARHRRRESRSRAFRRADRREPGPSAAGAQPGLHRRGADQGAGGRARQGRHRRARGPLPQGGVVEPPAVRGARDDPRLPRRWSRSTRARRRRRSPSPRSRPTRISPRSRTRSRPSPRRTCRSR